ncbi:hypothetical protein llap_7645 [Limosa lapponica baueri]|uniref:Uncharacterized protein n=1 Tax=Limosa lapponica baueri TaxID=1758121 RepID=A0A2I0U7N0_LIMLA|nr:hypothetical protein llap_7645 [Limosa lapponica baueri]
MMSLGFLMAMNSVSLSLMKVPSFDVMSSLTAHWGDLSSLSPAPDLGKEHCKTWGREVVVTGTVDEKKANVTPVSEQGKKEDLDCAFGETYANSLKSNEAVHHWIHFEALLCMDCFGRQDFHMTNSSHVSDKSSPERVEVQLTEETLGTTYVPEELRTS